MKLLLLSFITVWLFNYGEGVMYCSHPPLVPNAVCYEGPEPEEGETVRKMTIPPFNPTRRSFSTTFKQGSVVHYRCEDGYVLQGASDVTCRSTGQWSGLPSCVEDKNSQGEEPEFICEEAPTIDFGVCTPTNEEALDDEDCQTDDPPTVPPTDYTTEYATDYTTEYYTYGDSDTYDDTNGDSDSYDDSYGDSESLRRGKITTPRRAAPTTTRKLSGIPKVKTTVTTRRPAGNRQNLAGSTPVANVTRRRESRRPRTTTTLQQGLARRVTTTTKRTPRSGTMSPRGLISRSTTLRRISTRRRRTTVAAGARRLATSPVTVSRRRPTTVGSRKTTQRTTASGRGGKMTTKRTSVTRRRTTTKSPSGSKRRFAAGCSGARQIREATCECQSRYTMKGSAVAKCIGNEKWSSLPVCTPPSGNAQMTCSALPPVTGATCKKRGQALQGLQGLTGDLETDDVWIDMDPRTQNLTEGATIDSTTTMIMQYLAGAPPGRTTLRRITTRPTTPRRRLISQSKAGTTSNQDIYDCQCKPGYIQATDTLTIMCMENGEWSDLPRCRLAPSTQVVRYCGVPQEVENADCFQTNSDGSLRKLAETRRSLRALQLQGGQSVTYKCKDGYVIKGSATVTCSSQGTWSAFPTCESNSCDIPDIDYGTCLKVSQKGNTEILKIGEQARCACDPGYRMTGDPIIRCQAKNSLSSSPKCTFVRDTRPTCGAPPDVPGSGCECPDDDSEDDSQVFRSGDTVRYTCKKGYTMTGSATITCGQNGNWSAKPTCTQTVTKPPGCGPPRKVPNAYCPCETGSGNGPARFNVGDGVGYTCNTGFSLTGPSVVKCQADGSWTAYPTCKPNSGQHTDEDTDDTDDTDDTGDTYDYSYSDTYDDSANEYINTRRRG